VRPLPSQIEDFIQTRYTNSLTKEVTAALKESEPERQELTNLDTSRVDLFVKKKLAQIGLADIGFCHKVQGKRHSH